MIKILAWLNKSGSRIYRAEQIFKYLNRTGEFECVISPTEVTDEQIMWADIVFIQGVVDPMMIATLWAYHQERGKIIVADRDDMLAPSDDNPFAKIHKDIHAKAFTTKLIEIADQVIVTTSHIEKELKPLNKNIKKLPNYLDMEVWDTKVTPNESDTVRIGFIGSMTHREDVKMIMPAIREVITTTNSKFVVCGDDYFGRYFSDLPQTKYQYVQGTADFYAYPMLAHTLACDIGVAPNLPTDFNKGRSTLKFLEYGMLKMAGVYSPTVYDGIVKDGSTGFIAHTIEDWKTNLTLLVESKGIRNMISSSAYSYVRNNYDIKKHVNKWGDLFKRLVSRNNA